jgi:hypothetical protein
MHVVGMRAYLVTLREVTRVVLSIDDGDSVGHDFGVTTARRSSTSLTHSSMRVAFGNFRIRLLTAWLNFSAKATFLAQAFRHDGQSAVGARSAR